MTWRPEDRHDHSSQHQQKADKTRLAQIALLEPERLHPEELRRLRVA
ncbi:MAG: hypothetical protein MUE40_18575 [Anaerolineae bacterium]|jgi:hypothetical protein|nr:hypothetical protein [Anaerolineae bacterium]